MRLNPSARCFRWWVVATVVAVVLLPACTAHKVEVEPIEVKPIHLTMDINLRIQRELEEFFDFEKDAEAGRPPVTPQNLESKGDGR
jgi:hypothetical protein